MTARVLLPEALAWPHRAGWLLALVDWLADLGVLDPSGGLDVCEGGDVVLCAGERRICVEIDALGRAAEAVVTR